MSGGLIGSNTRPTHAIPNQAKRQKATPSRINFLRLSHLLSSSSLRAAARFVFPIVACQPDLISRGQIRQSVNRATERTKLQIGPLRHTSDLSCPNILFACFCGPDGALEIEHTFTMMSG